MSSMTRVTRLPLLFSFGCIGGKCRLRRNVQGCRLILPCRTCVSIRISNAEVQLILGGLVLVESDSLCSYTSSHDKHLSFGAVLAMVKVVFEVAALC